MAVAGGVAIFSLRVIHPEYFKSLLPFQRERAVTWNAIEIFLIVSFNLLILKLTAAHALDELGFFKWMYGVHLRDPKAPLERMGLWASAVAMPFELLFTALILGVRGETWAYQLGLTTSRWVQNVIVGFLGWLITTPLVFLVLIASVKVFTPEKHPIERFGQSNPNVAEWGLIFFCAIVQAPVIEEIVFRGVLQRWFMHRSWGPDLALALAFVVALTKREEDLKTALTSGNAGAIGHALAPALFVLLMIPGYIYCETIAWRWQAYAGVGRAIYATSLLFAVGHAFAWPTPIPLFFLSLVLGYLAYRTQSLVAPITLHAIFNAVTCIVLLLGSADTQDKKGSEETSALRRSAPTATSTPVPGSSLPRRTYPSAITPPSRGD
jgi:membrane protease YdiL (CAAX protease family)